MHKRPTHTPRDSNAGARFRSGRSRRRRPLLLVLPSLFVLLVACDTAPSGADQAAAAPPRVRIEFFPLGARRPTPQNPFGLARGVEDPGGYERFYEEEMTRAVARGASTIILHRPYGETPGGPMDLDMRVVLLESEGFGHVPREFRGMLQRLHREHPSVRVIVYLGTIGDRLRRLRDRGETRDLRRRLDRSIVDALAAPNCDLALDAASGEKYYSPWFQSWAEEVRGRFRDRGKTVYVEAKPKRDAWSADWPSVCIARFFARQHDNPQRRWTGTDIVVLTGHGPDRWLTNPRDFIETAQNTGVRWGIQARLSEKLLGHRR